MDNFATFHQIYSNMCLKSSRYVSTFHKTWSGEFRNKGTAKFAKNRRFLNRVYSLLPSCSAILDFSCWPHFRYVCVSNLCLLYLWLSPSRVLRILFTFVYFRILFTFVDQSDSFVGKVVTSCIDRAEVYDKWKKLICTFCCVFEGNIV